MNGGGESVAWTRERHARDREIRDMLPKINSEWGNGVNVPKCLSIYVQLNLRVAGDLKESRYTIYDMHICMYTVRGTTVKHDIFLVSR